MKRRNLSVELLRKLLKRELAVRRRRCQSKDIEGRMGEASKRGKPNEILQILYNHRDPFVYGCIVFFKHRRGGPPAKPYDQSAPFMVAKTLGPGEVVVHGSMDYLISDIRRLLQTVFAQIDEYNVALGHIPPTHVEQGERAILHHMPEAHVDHREHFEFTRLLAGTLILISTQARNLFQLLPRLDRKIDLFDQNGNRTGAIALTKLFAHFVHNQYLFLDGEHVSDLFPANPRKGAPIRRTFMGYRFNWIEYVESIESAIRDIKLNDLTGLLRGRLRKLSLESRYSDIVFLVQNLYSFSQLFEAMPEDMERYGAMLNLLFEEELRERLASVKPKRGVRDRVRFAVAFKAPLIAIHENLSERKFRVRVRCKWRLNDRKGRAIYEDQEFRDLSVEVGYEDLLDRVNQVFGNDPLSDFRP